MLQAVPGLPPELQKQLQARKEPLNLGIGHALISFHDGILRVQIGLNKFTTNEWAYLAHLQREKVACQAAVAPSGPSPSGVFPTRPPYAGAAIALCRPGSARRQGTCSGSGGVRAGWIAYSASTMFSQAAVEVVTDHLPTCTFALLDTLS